MANRLKHAVLITRSGQPIPDSAAALKNKVTLLYFSAEWCPPCKQFTPLLKQFYEKAKAGGEKIDIVFVSNDKSEAEMRSYFQNHHGDYLAVKYGEDAHRELPRELNIQGIPTVTVIDTNGKEVTNAKDVRQAVFDGATGSKSVSEIILGWRKASGDWTASDGKILNSSGVTPGKLSRDEMRAARLARFAGGTKPAAMSVNTKPPNVSNLDNTSKDARDKVNSPTATGDADDGLSILISMGFDKEKSTQMLEITAGDVEQAVALLTSQ